MPIYAYKCASCGYALDVLQKVSDAPLTTCPQCQATTFAKQLTAAGFQLRGNGWYATDFKNGPNKGGSTTEPKGSESKESASAGAAKAEKASTAGTGGCGHGGCSACS
jgi:putative FmdB family regulatory protein